jgi:hypothetical protein
MAQYTETVRTVCGDGFDRRILLKRMAQIDQFAIDSCSNDISAEPVLEHISHNGPTCNCARAAIECNRYFSAHLNASAEPGCS